MSILRRRNIRDMNDSDCEDILDLMKEKCQNYDPILMFFIGMNYTNMNSAYKTMSFFEGASILNRAISKKRHAPDFADMIYEQLQKNRPMGEILDTVWIKREKKGHQKQQNEPSLMIPKHNSKRLKIVRFKLDNEIQRDHDEETNEDAVMRKDDKLVSSLDKIQNSDEEKSVKRCQDSPISFLDYNVNSQESKENDNSVVISDLSNKNELSVNDSDNSPKSLQNSPNILEKSEEEKKYDKEKEISDKIDKDDD